MNKFALVFLLLSSVPAFAENGYTLGGSDIFIKESSKPGAEVEVVFNNYPGNDSDDQIQFSIETETLPVIVEFLFNTNALLGSDTILVTPPEGYICEPWNCKVTVIENSTGSIWLYRPESLGM